MIRPALEVADIFRAYGAHYRKIHGPAMSREQHRAMRAIEVCRTAVLGGHIDVCDECGAERNSYNSCRNRHCPKCQSLAKAEWLESRIEELLPVPYYHVVFTIPEEIASVAFQNKRVVYSILFRAAAETLRIIALDPKHLGAQIGFLAVLHTWTQTLLHHPHVHCVIPAGGLSPDKNNWISCREGFFLPVRVLSRLFRAKFLHYLKQAYNRGKLQFFSDLMPMAESRAFSQLLGRSRKSDWVVYAKRPFAGPFQVLDYLGRYTHRVAISNDRLVKLEGGKVTFRYRDRKDNDRIKPMTLDASEFIRRFLLHILPDGFVKIRHYGILSNRKRNTKLGLCKRLLGVDCWHEGREKKSESWQDLLTRITGHDPRICPYCGKGTMVLKEVLNPSALPLPP